MNDMEQTLDEQARLLSRAFGGRIESRETPDGSYQHTTKAERMTWTTEFPAKSGSYWVRNLIFRDPDLGGIGKPEVVDVIGGTCFYRAGSDVSTSKHEIASAEWQGPIHPPA